MANPNSSGMDKLGVETPDHNPDGTKTAASGNSCPICMSRLEKLGSVVRCPVHGTQPFERLEQNTPLSCNKNSAYPHEPLFSPAGEEGLLLGEHMAFRLNTIADLGAGNPLALGAALNLADLYDKSFEEEELDHRDPGVHASEINKCVRQCVYTLRKTPKTDRPAKDMAKRFLVGHAIHTMVQSRFSRIAEKKGGTLRFEAEVRTNDTIQGQQRLITSSCDGVFTWLDDQGEPFLRIGLEVKTESPDSWARVKAPKKEHIAQAHVYMKCLDVPLMWFFYYNKGTQETTPMAPPFLLEFDPQIWERLEQRIDTALSFKDHSQGELPLAEKGFHCTFCPYLRRCKGDDTLADDDRLKIPTGSP